MGLIAREEGRELGSDCEVPSIQLTGVGAVTVKITAYDATGKQLDRGDNFTLGTRVLLICDVTELQGDEVFSYRWYHSHTGSTQGRYQIHDRDPYYKVVDDTLLVDVMSWDQGGKYTCFVKFSNTYTVSSHSLSSINVAGLAMWHAP